MTNDSDVFILSGAEDLVPVLVKKEESQRRSQTFEKLLMDTVEPDAAENGHNGESFQIRLPVFDDVASGKTPVKAQQPNAAAP